MRRSSPRLSRNTGNGGEIAESGMKFGIDRTGGGWKYTEHDAEASGFSPRNSVSRAAPQDT
jgi:hypothetical protein